jgi:hypothetical protein
MFPEAPKLLKSIILGKYMLHLSVNLFMSPEEYSKYYLKSETYNKEVNNFKLPLGTYKIKKKDTKTNTFFY